MKLGDAALDPRTGLVSSPRSVLLALAPGDPRTALDRALAASGAALGGGAPQLGLVQLVLPDGTSFEARDAILARLRALDGVAAVSPDLHLTPDLLPEGATSRASPAWDWKSAGPPGAEGNWGLKSIGAPTAWNLVPWLRTHGAKVRVGVLDAQFTPHPDLARVLEVAEADWTTTPTAAHGSMVAGIIGAAWEGAEWAEGLAPGAELSGVIGLTLGGLIDLGRLSALTPLRVVNVSLGLGWRERRYPDGRRCDPREPQAPGDDGCSALLARATIELSGQLVGAAVQAMNLVSPTLFVVSAGNDSGAPPAGLGTFPAELASPWTWAALHTGARAHMIVVEASARAPSAPWDTVRAPYSNVDGGGVFAPGSDVGVLSFDGRGWAMAQADGTSFAAPLVAGAAAWLLAIEPTLDDAGLKALLGTPPYARPMDGGASHTAVALDLVGATFGLDEAGLRSGPPLGAVLADIDDGTPDGFQRSARDAAGAIVGPYTADAHGDGKVDLRDLRRLRDTRLMIAGNTTFGEPSSAKLDLDLDGRVDAPADEHFPRAGLDGDDTVGAASARFLGTYGTDVDVLMRWFTPDPVQPWRREDLPGLLTSADLHLHPAEVMAALGAEAILVDELGGNGDVGPAGADGLHDLRLDGEEVVLTTPLIHAATLRWRPICDGAPQDPPVDVRIGELVPGEDREVSLDPGAHARCCPTGQVCAPPEVRHTCSSTVAPNTSPRIYRVRARSTLEDRRPFESVSEWVMVQDCTSGACFDSWTLHTTTQVGSDAPSESTSSWIPSSFASEEVIMAHGQPLCTRTGVLCVPDGSTCLEAEMNGTTERSCTGCGDQGPTCVDVTWAGASCVMRESTWVPCPAWDESCAG